MPRGLIVHMKNLGVGDLVATVALRRHGPNPQKLPGKAREWKEMIHNIWIITDMGNETHFLPLATSLNVQDATYAHLGTQAPRAVSRLWTNGGLSNVYSCSLLKLAHPLNIYKRTI